MALIERRKRLADSLGLSVRTVERLEEQGFELMDYLMREYQLNSTSAVRIVSDIGSS